MSTPKGQRLATRFTSDTELTPVDAATPSHKTSANRSGQCNSHTTTSQAVPKPAAPARGENAVASAAHLDLLAAEHPQQVVPDKPQAATPVLTDQDLRLAELHAHIIAGELH